MCSENDIKKVTRGIGHHRTIYKGTQDSDVPVSS